MCLCTLVCKRVCVRALCVCRCVCVFVCVPLCPLFTTGVTETLVENKDAKKTEDPPTPHVKPSREYLWSLANIAGSPESKVTMDAAASAPPLLPPSLFLLSFFLPLRHILLHLHPNHLHNISISISIPLPPPALPMTPSASHPHQLNRTQEGRPPRGSEGNLFSRPRAAAPTRRDTRDVCVAPTVYI